MTKSCTHDMPVPANGWPGLTQTGMADLTQTGMAEDGTPLVLASEYGIPPYSEFRGTHEISYPNEPPLIVFWNPLINAFQTSTLADSPRISREELVKANVAYLRCISISMSPDDLQAVRKRALDILDENIKDKYKTSENLILKRELSPNSALLHTTSMRIYNRISLDIDSLRMDHPTSYLLDKPF